jgi:ABC-type sugar transport system substrate-binding protein
MATFLRNVWSGSDEPAFGLIEAVQALGRDDLAVIIGWARDPFFPLITDEQPRQ